MLCYEHAVQVSIPSDDKPGSKMWVNGMSTEGGSDGFHKNAHLYMCFDFVFSNDFRLHYTIFVAPTHLCCCILKLN